MNKKGRGLRIDKVNDLPRRLRLFFILILVLFVCGSLSFMLIEKINIIEALLRTLESLAFMFSSEKLIGKLLEIFLAIFGVFCIWWILWSIADMFIEGKISEYLKIRFNTSKLNKMENHYIIVGGGRVGEEIAKDLHKNKKDFLIIEKDTIKTEKLKKKNYPVLEGDAYDIESDILIKANIKKANSIVLVMPEIEKNLMLTLTSKELNPNIDIYVRSDNPLFASKLKKAGARAVIIPEIVTAEKFLQEFR
jgi:voltage-gated potassium channel